MIKFVKIRMKGVLTYVTSGEVPECLRHGETVTLLLLCFLYLIDLLTDILSSSIRIDDNIRKDEINHYKYRSHCRASLQSSVPL